MVQKSGHDHQGCCPLSGSGLWGPTPSIHHHVSRSRPSCEPILQVELGAKQGSLYDTPPNLLETKKKGEILETHHTFCNCLIFHFTLAPFAEGLEGKIPLPKHQPIQPEHQTSARGLDHGGFEDGFIRNGTQPGRHWHLGERSRWGLPGGNVT